METIFLPPVELKAVKCLEIHYLPTAILLPVAVSPEQLKQLKQVRRFETSDEKDFEAAYEALLSSGPSLDLEGSIDARWSVFFLGENKQGLLSTYTDSFGRQGVVDGYVVTFTAPAFLQWLEGRFAA